jgi:hypothetical protein
MEPVQRTIWLCDRDLDGRKNTCNFRCHKQQFQRESLLNSNSEYTKHWFLIISNKATQKFVTAVPITSHEYQVELDETEQINDGDIVDSQDSINSFQFKKTTYIVYSRPCRIPIEDFESKQDYGRLKEDSYYNKFLLPFKRCFT